MSGLRDQKELTSSANRRESIDHFLPLCMAGPQSIITWPKVSIPPIGIPRLSFAHLSAKYGPDHNQHGSSQPDLADLGVLLEDGEDGEHEAGQDQGQRHTTIAGQMELMTVETDTEDHKREKAGREEEEDELVVWGGRG